MNPFRKSTILRAVLETLIWADGYAVPEATLRPQVDASLRPPITDEEWTAAIAELSSDARKAIVNVPAELDPTMAQWAITTRGRTLFATL